MTKRRKIGWRVHLDKILSVWLDSNLELSFSEIHRKFVEYGIVSNIKYKASTVRILKKLIEEGYIEKTDRGYRLKIEPKQFDITAKIRDLQLKYGDSLIWEWRNGGIFWARAEGVILGLPKNIERNPYFKHILDVLLVRLAHIFDAIRALAYTARLMEKEGVDLSSAPVPREAVREYILNILPHILGGLSGIDFDGLPEEILLKVLERINKCLQKEVNKQPIMKELLQKYLEEAEQLLYLMPSYEYLDDLLGALDRKLYAELNKVILIVYPPKEIIYEDNEEKILYDYLKWNIERGYSNAILIAEAIKHEEKVVSRVLRYLRIGNLLSKEELDEIESLYHMACAGRILNRLLRKYYYAKKKKKLTSKKINILKNTLRKAINKYSLENMIKGVWLSEWPPSIHPRFLYKYFKLEEDTKAVEAMEEAIVELLSSLNMEPPVNLRRLLQEGYSLAVGLNKEYRKDLIASIEDFKIFQSTT